MVRIAHRTWLRISAILVGAFGPVFAAGGIPATAQAARWSLDLLSWPLDGNMTYADPTTRFLSVLTGGFLLGWGTLLWMLASHVHPLAPEPTRRAVVAGFVAWFLLDSTGSILSGNASNALFNVGVLVALVGPMWRPERKPD